jgi:hypothetical protein
MKETIELLENLDSPDPADFFVYLNILHKLKSEMLTIDIHVRLEKHVKVDGPFPSHSFVELSQMTDQLGYSARCNAGKDVAPW